VDLTITIKEKPTGNLSLGAGFSSADKLALTAAIKQDNVFGSGNYLGVEVNTSQSNKTLVLSTVDPYFTIDGISRAFDLYYRTTRPLNSQGEEYELVTPGVGDALRRAVQRVRHGLLRRRLRAHRDPRRERTAEQLLPVPRESTARSAAACR
jgi:outer membrane protein assembly factor BamA